MKIAIAHDYLTQRGGAERVVLSMLKAFPGAPLHTSLVQLSDTYPAFADADIRTLPLNRVEVLRQHHRLALPLLAPAFSSHRIDADVVLCSSSGWAHGVGTTGRKIVFCYSPARWLYQSAQYLGNHHPVARYVLGAARPWLLRWDRRKACTASRYLTLSKVVQERIWENYGIDAEVLPPPHTIDVTGPQRPHPTMDPGFFLCVSRLLAYKNVDAVISAFGELRGERLVVVGSGPEGERLRHLAGTNVTFLGAVDDDELRWLYAACSAVISASHEDYGLTPLEAAAFGKPTVVLRGGGFLDTVVEGRTGVFFDDPQPSHIVVAIKEVLSARWQVADLHAQAARFDEGGFIQRLQEIVYLE